MTTKSHDFDAIIIGGGLSGLLLAAQLSKLDKKIALVEANEELGGHSKAFNSPFGEMDYELKFFPNSASAPDTIAWLEYCLDETIGAVQVEAPPQTFDSGKSKEFVGFGDNAAQSCDDLNYYAAGSQFRFDKTPKDWVKILRTKLAEHSSIQIFNKSEVTSLITQDHFISGVVINANKTLIAKDFIWAAPINTLAAMMNEENLPLRQKQKLAKTTFFASVQLDLIFSKKLCDHSAVLILQGANEEPLAGRFTDLDETHQLSQWVCLLPNQEADSEETVASVLKYMKRQISRVYEGIMDFKVYERITLNNLTHGKVSFDRDDSQFGKLKNLWVSQACLSSSGNLLGSLEQAQKLWLNYEKLQFSKPEAEIRPLEA